MEMTAAPQAGTPTLLPTVGQARTLDLQRMGRARTRQAVGPALSGSDDVAKLEQLGELYKQGVLDYHEFQQAKARLLGNV